jgi:hypothetical protein
MIVVGGDITVGKIFNVTPGVAEPVPDRLAPAVFFNRAFYLVGRSSGAPEKIGRELFAPVAVGAGPLVAATVVGVTVIAAAALKVGEAAATAVEGGRDAVGAALLTAGVVAVSPGAQAVSRAPVAARPPVRASALINFLR